MAVSELKLFLLGAPRIELNGLTVQMERRKAFALVTYLAVTREICRRDTLATLFWPGLDQQRARAALRRTLASIKKDLHPSPLVVSRETVGLDEATAGRFWCDVGRFYDLLQNCRGHLHAELETCTDCTQWLAEAVSLSRGPFLAGFTLPDCPSFDDWQLWQSETLQLELAWSLEHLAHAHIERCELDTALDYVRRWQALDPLHEPAGRLLMSLYAWTGQRPAALRHYAELCRLLELELGLAPEPETAALYQTLGEGAPRLPGPAVESSMDAAVVPAPRAMVALPHPTDSQDERDSRLALLDNILQGQLVGREHELAQILGLWRRAAAGRGQALLLAGPAGIGKTRLAGQLASEAASSGGLVLAGRCQMSGSAPYAPLAQLIGEASLDPRVDMAGMPDYVTADLLYLAPHLGPRFAQIRPNPPLHPLYERQRIFESFATWCQLLARNHPVLIWIEDLHWTDIDTLNLFHHLARQLPKLRLLLVATYRSAEVALAEQGAIHETLLALEQARLAVTIDLGPLSREQSRQQLAALLAMPDTVSDAFLDLIYQHSEGNPFFLEEICKSLVEAGQLYRVGQQWYRLQIEQIEVPKSLQGAIGSRLSRLPRPVQEALHLAAVIGREFDLSLLQAAGQWDPEEVITNLDYAARAQLLQASAGGGEARLAFAHALIPYALRQNLGAPRLQRLHQRIALALETQRPGDYDSLGYHFAAAGQSEKALTYLLQAAEQASRLYAHESAIQHLRTALALAEAAGPEHNVILILERLADILRLRRNEAPAADCYREALVRVQAMDEPEPMLAMRLRRKFGETVFGSEWFEELQPFALTARIALDEGLHHLTGQPPHPELVRILIALSQAAWRGRTQQDWTSAEAYATAALSAAETLGLPMELSAALDALAVVEAARGRHHARLDIIERRLELSRDPAFSDTRQRIHLLNEAGVALSDVGRFAEAIGYHQEAELLAMHIRAFEELLSALRSQAHCAYRLDRWDEVMMEEKFKLLQHRFPDDQLSPSCLHQALQAAVLARRGRRQEAAVLREASLAEMIKGEAPERWGRPAHY